LNLALLATMNLLAAVILLSIAVVATTIKENLKPTVFCKTLY
jgi:hypothetical protein